MHLRKGKIVTHRDSTGGYFMIMSFTKEKVTISPIFGYHKIIYHTYERRWWDDMHKKYNDKGLHPIIQARFDHEKMRRLNKL